MECLVVKLLSHESRVKTCFHVSPQLRAKNDFERAFLNCAIALAYMPQYQTWGAAE